MLRHLDLFSGFGGWALAAQWTRGIQTIGFCEIEEFPRRVLAKNFPGVPIHDDIRTITPEIVADWGGCDLITASYPCQPFSTAGQRRGADDGRHLWPEVARLIAGLRPRWVCAENVTGHISLGFDSVLDDMEGLGYTTGQAVVPACSVGARHKRERLWVVAHLDREGQRQQERVEQEQRGWAGNISPANLRVKWSTGPGILRRIHGVPDRMDRVGGLGNAIVPQVAYQILEKVLVVDADPAQEGE